MAAAAPSGGSSGGAGSSKGSAPRNKVSPQIFTNEKGVSLTFFYETKECKLQHMQADYEAGKAWLADPVNEVPKAIIRFARGVSVSVLMQLDVFEVFDFESCKKPRDVKKKDGTGVSGKWQPNLEEDLFIVVSRDWIDHILMMFFEDESIMRHWVSNGEVSKLIYQWSRANPEKNQAALYEARCPDGDSCTHSGCPYHKKE